MKQLNNKKLITLLISLILFIAILWLSFSSFGNAPSIQKVTSDMTAVFGRVLAKPVNGINRLFSDINLLEDTFIENKRLKQEIDRLGESQAELSTYKAENEKLKEELNLQETLTEYNIITGTVISRNPDRWIDQIIIDRGSNDGLENGMSIMSSNGLIGRISEVNPTSSRVTLLTTNDQDAVLTSSEIIQEDETIFGVINGFDTTSKRLIMEQITSDTNIEVGQEVVTSGLGGLVPKGLLVGTVAEVTLDRHGLGQRVYVEPAADFEDIRFVTIVQRTAELIDSTESE